MWKNSWENSLSSMMKRKNHKDELICIKQASIINSENIQRLLNLLLRVPHCCLLFAHPLFFKRRDRNGRRFQEE